MLIMLFIGFLSPALGSPSEQSPTFSVARAVVSIKVERTLKFDKNICLYEARLEDVLKNDPRQLLAVGTTIQISAAGGTSAPPVEAHVIFLGGHGTQWRLIQDDEKNWDDPGPRCVAGGGEMGRAGRAGNVFCIKPYPDAGKPCTDGSQCLGGCFYKGPQVSTGTSVAGVCKENNFHFGCMTPVIKGMVKYTRCVD
jgi:hypothetical protein